MTHFNVIIFLMRILCLIFSHKIKNKIERQIDTIFCIMLLIMLLGTHCNFDFYIYVIKLSTNHFIGYKKPQTHYKSKHYSLWIYFNSVISFPAYFSRFVTFFKECFIHVTILLRNTCTIMFRSSLKYHFIGVFRHKGALWGWIWLCQLSLCLLCWHLRNFVRGVC